MAEIRTLIRQLRDILERAESMPERKSISTLLKFFEEYNTARKQFFLEKDADELKRKGLVLKSILLRIHELYRGMTVAEKEKAEVRSKLYKLANFVEDVTFEDMDILLLNEVAESPPV